MPLYDKLLGKDHKDKGKVVGSLGIIEIQQGKYKEGAELLNQALQILGENHPSYEGYLGTCASVERILGNLDSAKTKFEGIISKMEKKLGKNNVKITPFQLEIGAIYEQLGKLQECKAIYEKVLDIQYKHYGQDHKILTHSLGFYTQVLSTLHELEKGKQICDKWLKIAQKNYGEHHQETIRPLQSLGIYYIKKRNFKEAQNHFELSNEISIKNFGKDHI